MRALLIYGCIMFLHCGLLHAQVPDTICSLTCVTITDRIIPPNKILTTLDSVLETSYVSSSLTNWLTRNSTSVIKQYASGTLSTVSALGFGAAQNQVIWNGLNLNNSMNGTQDLNLIPMWFIKSSANHTNVNYINTGKTFHTVSDVSETNNVSAFTTITSAKNVSSGFKFQKGNDKSTLTISGITSHQQNNIPFYNIYELEKAKLTHAKAVMQGIQIYYRKVLHKNLHIEPSLWYISANRQIPPSMLQIISRAVEIDKQFRSSLKLNWSHHAHQIEWMNALAQDVILYNDSTIGLYASNRSQLYQNQLQWHHSPLRWLKQSTIFRYQNMRAVTDNYDGKAKQERFFLQYTPQITLNNNSAMVGFSGALEHFAPNLLAWSAGGFLHIKYAKHWFSVCEAGRVYRLPTLNDLYWHPGGNRSLVPETTYKYESSIRYSANNTIALESELKGFYFQSSNLIIWRPNGNSWMPLNVRSAASYGVSDVVHAMYKFKSIHILLECSYTFNITKITGTNDKNDLSLNKPIPYTPRHRCYLTTAISYSSHRLIVQQEYTSLRFGSFDEVAMLPSYYTTDIEYRKQLMCAHHQFDIGCKVHNLLNTSYQTILWQPMPGRFYSLHIYYSYSKTNHSPKPTK